MSETIVVTDGFTLNPGDLDWKRFETFGEVRVYDRSDAAETLNRCRQATVIITNKTIIDKQVIDAAKNLKMIAVTATGHNVVDSSHAREKNIPVCNVPGYGANSVAQHTFALILELTNHVGKNSKTVSQSEWSSSLDWCYTLSPIIELSGKVLGIIGYGSIGRQVAMIGRAFGMKVIYASRSKTGGSEERSIEEVFRESDIVSLHCPLTSDNREFVNRKLLTTMKPSSYLVNTARGLLINENDLARALNESRIAGAALDVLSVEPPSPDNPLINARNCIITPHNAWLSVEARRRMMDMTFENVKNMLRGSPEHVVNLPQ